MKNIYFSLCLSLVSLAVFAQDIELYTQFNGHYDYTAIGNTLNDAENNETQSTSCTILTSASASLSLLPTQNITAAYLYWAGSGTGDFSVKLNNQSITADRTFAYTLNSSGQSFPFFAAFTDVTTQVTTTGNGTYTLSDLDLTSVIPTYCYNATNFAGWSIIIIYEDASLPLNQVSVYDGLQGVHATVNNLQIVLDNLNVVDNIGAKIGFLAWEGDEGLAINETLRINGNILSTPLNPANNAFNGTNSYTGMSNLYNMDLDVYDIENNINIGDTSAIIELTSGDGINGDFIMINNVVTVLNSEVPNPSPIINAVITDCGSRDILVDYTITNNNCTGILPAGTQIDFYANTSWVGQTSTQNDIPIDGSETYTYTLNIPQNIPDSFTLELIVNKDLNGNSIIPEANEDDNIAVKNVALKILKIAETPVDIIQCDDSSNDGISSYNFTENYHLVLGNQTSLDASFYTSLNDAENENNPIPDYTDYLTNNLPQVIYIRIYDEADPSCYRITSFMIDLYYQPTATPIPDQHICLGISETPLAYSLAINKQQIIDNQPDVSVRFFQNQTDAEANLNHIQEVMLDEQSLTIYYRVENNLHPACYAIASFKLSSYRGALTTLPPLTTCNEGKKIGTYKLTEIENYLPEGNYLYFETKALAVSQFIVNITNPESYTNTKKLDEIYIRSYENDPTNIDYCGEFYKVSLLTEKCPPRIPQGFSPNADGINDTFFISGLYDIFEDFHLKIFSRYGTLIYEGWNHTQAWDGTSNRGLLNQGEELPTGTYFYVLDTKDAKFGTYKGWVYLNR